MNLLKSIILTGIKHSGKSTQGKALSSYYNCPFYDTDSVIQELTGKSPREIYNDEGKDSFLSAEKLACQYLKSISENKKIIVATGGGICDNNEAIRFLTTNTVFIYLFVDEKTAIERIIREAQTDGEKITNQDSIPSYLAKKNPQTISDLRNFFHNFYVERTKKYSMLADITINQGDSSIEENTKKIISAIKTIQH